jgi:ABC-type multidrug transport system fused ATPase/permease subunit
LVGVFVLTGAFVMAYAMVLASALLHKNMLHNVLRSPMAFFDVTPLGRVINRFGKDIDILDNTMVKKDKMISNGNTVWSTVKIFCTHGITW